MKFKFLIFFCLLYSFAFSQNDSVAVIPKDSVLAPLDTVSVPLDTNTISVPDSIITDTTTANTAIIDSTIIDTTIVDSTRIKSGLHFFVSVGAQFISFNHRAKFQGKIEAELDKYIADTLDGFGRFKPEMQPFQSVNLAFPISAGVIWQFSDKHSVGLGAGFLYDNESVVLTDRNGENHNFHYTLQAFPIFAEYRLLISPDLFSLNNGDYFSIFARYYWMLPHTEFSSSWGTIEAKPDPLGSGFGVFLGYRFWTWESLSIWGELGYLSLEVDAKRQNDLLNSWNLGGISILFRATF